jgi:uncharacterized repeat protein (TIGR01451 family)
MANPAYTGSQVTAANSSSLPAIGAMGTVAWVGRDLGMDPDTSYRVPAASGSPLTPGTLTLVYTTTVQNTAPEGFYINSVTARVNTTTIGPATTTFSLPGTASIGDYVWNDVNGDGLQAAEAGLAGVRVYVDSDSDGTYDVGEPTAVTAANGSYTIGSLPAGTFTVRVDPSTVTGYLQTYDLNGPLDNSASVTLTSGQVRTDVDFGYREDVTLTIAKDFSNNDPADTPEETATAGSTGNTFRIVVSNTGTSTADNVHIRDTVDSRLVVTNVSADFRRAFTLLNSTRI